MSILLRNLLLLSIVTCSTTAAAEQVLSDATLQSGFSQAQATRDPSQVGKCDIVKGVTYFPITSTIVLPAYASLTNLDVRKWYLEQEAKIPDLVNHTCTLEQQAYQAWSLRNSFRTAARYAMTNQDEATALNKDRSNLTWEQTKEKYSQGRTEQGQFEEIINASQRSNAEVNKSLGLTPTGQ